MILRVANVASVALRHVLTGLKRTQIFSGQGRIINLNIVTCAYYQYLVWPFCTRSAIVEDAVT